MRSRYCIVLIFSHKPALEWFERISLAQCFRVLGRHPIRLVCPLGLDVSEYRAIVPNIEVDFIPAEFMGSYGAYNKMKTSSWIYRRYAAFDYMMTHELDALVFRDELVFWCAQGWDFIGAPWFTDFSSSADDGLWAVGNGGFSIRRINTYLRVLKSSGPQDMAEDAFFAFHAKEHVRGFRIPTPTEALPFSFECAPRDCYELSGRRLPFGCHAWKKYDLKFWQEYSGLNLTPPKPSLQAG